MNPECCAACAVGNILDNDDSWKEFSIEHGSLKLTYLGSVYEKSGKTFNGYSPLEILRIEKVFLEAKPLLNEDFIVFAYDEEKPIGMIINFPDFNQSFQEY